MFDFTGRVVMITGAAGNLGETAARAFHAAGARLVLTDNRQDRLHRVFGDMLNLDDCLMPAIDITDETAVNGMVAHTLEHYDRIDILVNIAGGFRAGTAVHETPLSDWEFMLNLNARSAFIASRAVIPVMLKHQHGRLINVSARAALAGKANMGAYIASKSAVLRLTESMSEELKHEGITVNAVLPGTIDTPRNRSEMPNADFEKWVTPAALTDVILFLASDSARAVTGAAIPVYGRS